MNWVGTSVSMNKPRITAACLLAVCVLAAAYLLSVFLLAPLLDSYSERFDMRERASRVQAVLNSGKSIQSQLTHARREISGHPGFLRGDTESLAASFLHSEVQGMVMRHGGTVNSFSGGRSDQDQDGLVELTVRISFSISHNGFIDLLGELENEREDVFLSNLSVQSHHGIQGVNRDLAVRLLAGALYYQVDGVVHDG